ncbi:MAG TPA: PrsW family intramembrane metalloprotease [Euryarchaeota archaeon]|nr:MAG: hypothetical protein B6U90_05940 [Thermoplasmatales archaeon ex4484_6]HHD16721.1 PrsW family intramembrane metalloprotease [Euryarchaeota archaeon]
MKYEKISFSEIMKGVARDFGSLGAIIVIVFFLTMLMGSLFILIFIFKEALILMGTILSVLLIPIVIIIGVILNKCVYNKIPLRKRGAWTLFRRRGISPKDYSTSYRTMFISSRFAFLSIMIILFFMVLITTGILNILPYFCCIFAPVSIPLIIITITLPAMAWISFTYAFDPYQPMPRGMIVIGILWGMLSTFPSLFGNTFNSLWMENMGLDTAVFSAPLVEEFFKMLGFFLIYSQIKDETDGIIFGAAFGAGFSLMENMIYGGSIVFVGGGIPFVILVSFRSFFNILGHMLGPALIGFLIGFNKRYLSRKYAKVTFGPTSYTILRTVSLVILVIFGFSFGILNHALWNYLAGFGLSWVMLLSLGMGMIQFLLFIGLVLVGYFLATERFNEKLKMFKNTGSHHI